MQHFLFFLLITFAVTLNGCASSSPQQQPFNKPIHAAQPETPASLPEAQTLPYIPSPFDAPNSSANNATLEGHGGRIGLILPLKSTAFSRAANTVKEGFMAALSLQTKSQQPAVKVYVTDDLPGSILEAYQLAIQDGSQIIVGPLTRNGVASIAESGLVSVPTIALNIPDNNTSAPPNLYFFGISVEGEARQVARMAFNEGKMNAVTLTANSPLSKRSQQAFSEEWQHLGGKIVAQYGFTDNVSSYYTLRSAVAKSEADMIFLAADYTRARMARPYLGVPIPTYATSQIYGGKNETSRDIDLENIRFVEMPWLLQPDHPAVMIYPRQEKFIGPDYERLYALGIDAFRIAEIFLSSSNNNFVLDGVTGKITLDHGNQFTRELTPAVFHQGIAVSLEATMP